MSGGFMSIFLCCIMVILSPLFKEFIISIIEYNRLINKTRKFRKRKDYYILPMEHFPYFDGVRHWIPVFKKGKFKGLKIVTTMEEVLSE